MSKYLSLSCFFNYLAVGMGKWAKEDPQESFAEEGGCEHASHMHTLFHKKSMEYLLDHSRFVITWLQRYNFFIRE